MIQITQIIFILFHHRGTENTEKSRFAVFNPYAARQEIFMNISREGAKTRRDIEELAAIVIDVALQLHRDLGAGLLESVFPETSQFSGKSATHLFSEVWLYRVFASSRPP